VDFVHPLWSAGDGANDYRPLHLDRGRSGFLGCGRFWRHVDESSIVLSIEGKPTALVHWVDFMRSTADDTAG
jgi:hypothetical protein